MANQSIIAAKAEKVDEIKQKIEKAQSVVIIDYRGFTVSEVSELRANMRAAKVEYLVLKNGIVERAVKAAQADEALLELLKGPNAFAFGYEDAVAPAKILKEFIKKAKKGELKGGIVENKFCDAKAIEALADLPSRDVLIARLLGSMKSPVTKFAIALDQIKQKLEKGEPLLAAATGTEDAAPVAVEEQAPAETPAE